MKQFGLVTCMAALCAVACLLVSTSAIALDVVLLEENFDSLILGESVQEAPGTPDVWTNIPPDGWVIENDMPEGMDEWEGWAFPDAIWWTNIAGDQDRNRFTLAKDGKAENIIAVADPDEWDDADAGGGPYNTSLSTPPISIVEVLNANSIQLIYDSSWRPEDTQNAAVSVAFDGDEPVDILLMTSVGTTTRWEEPFAGIEEMIPDLEQANETVTLGIPNPDDAKTMVISWRMFDATNDWWWAIDNIRVVTDSFAVAPDGKLATTWASVRNQ